MAEIELTTVLADDKEGYVHARLPEESLYVNTRYGKVWVTIQGDRDKTPFITFPDIGLNSTIQFNSFFNFEDNEPLMRSFCAIHINAPGQEENSSTLPANYSYPSCDQLAETVVDVVNHFRLKNVICFGIGMGANILARFALLHQDLVTGCVFINLVTTKAGWIEWGYQKWNRWYLASGQYTEFTKNYLLWHHFGYQTLERNYDLIETYSRIFSRLNPVNLSHLINAYINRTDLGIQRKDFESHYTVPTFNFKCSILNVMGDSTPHDDDVIDTNGRLDPTKSSLVKFSDCGGMVLEEQPAKMAEALRYFLQGIGYVPSLSVTHHSLSNRNGIQAMKQKALLKQVSLDADQDILNSIHLETDSLVPNVERFPSKLNFPSSDTANA